jgi:ankyrin repeat protein
VNVKNDDGVTPIYAAAIHGQDETTNILLELGADADNV